MFYKPAYCCHCGEKIDRAKWGITASRRFCQSCESEFTLKEWLPRAVVFIGVVGALFGFGAVLTRKTEKPLSVVTTAQKPISANAPQNQKNQPPLSSAVAQNPEPSLNTANNSASAEQQAQGRNFSDPNRAGNLRLQTGAKSADKQNSSSEAVYFCGAQTKKGMPCSRRVKGGGRCWQHAGQAAMLPPEKLSISR